MRQLTATFLLLLPLISWSQSQAKIREFDHFSKVNELMEALKKFDLTPFLEQDVTWIADTLETRLPLDKVSRNLKGSIKLPKKYTVAQASESNHGYTQTYGFYDSEEVAVYFVTMRINPLTQKVEEVKLEANR